MYRKSKRKNENDRLATQLCCICLSSDRILTALTKLEKGFQQITDELDLNMVSTSLLCWECISLLKKVYWFKERAKKSQILLSHMNGSEVTLPSLSNLKVVKLTSINAHITVVPADSTSLEEEIKTEIDDCEDPLKEETEFGLKRPDDYINADETKTNEAVQNDDTEISENVENTGSVEVKSEYEDDFEYPEDIEPNNYLDVAESKPVNNVSESKSENKKVKKNKIKRKQEESDSDFELPKNIKKAIEKEFNIGTSFTKSRGLNSTDNYKLIRHYRLTSNLRSFVPITPDELMVMREKERNSADFRSLEKKCDLCLSKVSVSDSYHYGKFHRETIKKIYSCDICQTYLEDKIKLERHIKKHYFKQHCNMCGFETLSNLYMAKHLTNMHSRIFQCRQCEAKFENKWVFIEHFKEMHAKFQCDHCKKIFRLKQKLERHIFSYHTIHKCKVCHKAYTDYRCYKVHIAVKHTVEKSEATYCVTCDIHFDNTLQYRKHCDLATIHRQEGGIRGEVKCAEPECLKLFTSKNNMMAHYQAVHLKTSKCHCAVCGKQFFRKSNLIYHRKIKHEGYKKEKNKKCQYCGRGFSEYGILRNHIRTHTGERPFKCSECDAKFAQKVALTMHVKHVHMKIKRNNKGEASA